MPKAEILLTERDLARMPSALREQLLIWYVHVQEVVESEELAEDFRDFLDASEEVERQVTFGEFLATGVIKTGDKLFCQKLKRHRAVLSGDDDFIEGASMNRQGLAVFQEHEYSTPSQLAVAMANSVEGVKPVKALNGYQYVYAEVGTGTKYSLSWLRHRVLRKEKKHRSNQYVMGLIMAAGNPVLMCPYCKTERLQETSKELSADGGTVTLVRLVCGHTIASHAQVRTESI